MRNSIAAALLAGACSAFLFRFTSASAADITVTGLSLGMTPDEAKSKLGSAFTFKDFPNPNPGLSTLSALNTTQTDAYGLEFADNKLFYVAHDVVFSPGAQPNKATLEDQLNSKYGKQTFSPEMGNYIKLTWEYADDGSLLAQPGAQDIAPESLKKSIRQGECKNNLFSLGTDLPGASGNSISFPRQFGPECKRIVQATYYPDASNKQTIARLVVLMEDGQAIFQHLQKTADDLQKKKDQDAQKAKSNAAPL